MIKILKITSNLKLKDKRNQLSTIKPGNYEIINSTNTKSGYDFIIENDLIIVGVYLVNSHFIDFTTKLYIPFSKWNKCIFEHEPILKTVEDKLVYSFYRQKNSLFK